MKFAIALSALVLWVFARAAFSDEPSKGKIIPFEWQPKSAPAGCYDMADPQDMHRIIIPKGAENGGAFPVVMAFHGQPRRKVAPRDYKFIDTVQNTVEDMIAKKEIPPVVLVFPVFRFLGGNWPGFDVRAFKKEVVLRLANEKITPTYWLAFGHSGAAGCGGDGLNRIHRLEPKAVGFFDTCLGQGWQDEIQALQIKGIKTVNIFSVETAGFRPKQATEYQSSFDFGRAFRPLGLKPIACPKVHPGVRLRKQQFRCASTRDKLVTAFVVDTGEGEQAHTALVEPAVRYFLKTFVLD